ncbi:uncharacterized protein EV154DRAFT_561840 [Mucor mucedo]|uniref:uncharacterized protein n=1 Tax=Mucor mucedo TaxID=29922 RepID=UPI00221FB08A|nr:uncharacterized protein EV154DRAFT_561840 [Mucor mucedo]KAI7892923.1 hypothetical protein EV154DRAFT_561840 [Mucor mucedo]
MHLSSVLTLLGTATLLVFEAYAVTKHSKSPDTHQLNPAVISFQRRKGDLQPVSFLQRSPSKRLYHERQFNKASLHKRDYATTLKYLRAAMNSYRKDFVTPPPVELIQLEEQLPPTAAPPLPVGSVPSSPVAYAPVAASPMAPPPPPVAAAPALPPVTQIPELDTENPSTPAADDATPTEAEKGAESSDTKIPVIDWEEDDIFDPEEDPSDVGPPPVVNGIPVDREE